MGGYGEDVRKIIQTGQKGIDLITCLGPLYGQSVTLKRLYANLRSLDGLNARFHEFKSGVGAKHTRQLVDMCFMADRIESMAEGIGEPPEDQRGAYENLLVELNFIASRFERDVETLEKDIEKHMADKVAEQKYFMESMAELKRVRGPHKPKTDPPPPPPQPDAPMDSPSAHRFIFSNTI